MDALDRPARPDGGPVGPERAAGSHRPGEGLPVPSGALLKATAGVLARQAEPRLRARLQAGLDAIFSDAARLALQQQAEAALRSLLEAALELIPDPPAGPCGARRSRGWWP